MCIIQAQSFIHFLFLLFMVMNDHNELFNDTAEGKGRWDFLCLILLLCGGGGVHQFLMIMFQITVYIQ